MHKWKDGTSLSATSIGTEENLLRVLWMHNWALIYMGTSQTVLRSVSFPTDLFSVLSQSLRRALSCALCLSLRLFHCLPMRGSRPHSA